MRVRTWRGVRGVRQSAPRAGRELFSDDHDLVRCNLAAYLTWSSPLTTTCSPRQSSFRLYMSDTFYSAVHPSPSLSRPPPFASVPSPCPSCGRMPCGFARRVRGSLAYSSLASSLGSSPIIPSPIEWPLPIGPATPQVFLIAASPWGALSCEPYAHTQRVVHRSGSVARRITGGRKAA